MHKSKTGLTSKAGAVFVGLGAVLILSALLLFLYNEWNNAVMEERSASIYTELSQMIAQNTQHNSLAKDDPDAPAPTTGAATVEQETAAAEPNMTVVLLDGYEYIGILDLPMLSLSLPILSDWDEQRLKIAPCRQEGAVDTDDLVIAGHNYRRHFQYLYKLQPGDIVRFTDMNGTITTYTVSLLRTLDATDVDAALNSEHDLVLYTCTYSGKERTTVFCDRAAENAAEKDEKNQKNS